MKCRIICFSYYEFPSENAFLAVISFRISFISTFHTKNVKKLSSNLYPIKVVPTKGKCVLAEAKGLRGTRQKVVL